jgi:hypothetical protein
MPVLRDYSQHIQYQLSSAKYSYTGDTAGGRVQRGYTRARSIPSKAISTALALAR